jgi:tetratricopeptide (TPR) repeat protein
MGVTGLASITKVFLSSTAKDLGDHREAAYRAIEGLDGFHCVRMEDFGARAWEGDAFCRAEVAKCGLFVGVLGHRYGSIPPGCEDSYTQREYNAAQGLPRLMFLARSGYAESDEEPEPEELQRLQQAFREQVNSGGLIRDTFTTPDDLAWRVARAIHNWSIQRRGNGPLIPLPPQPDLVHPYALQDHFTGRVPERTMLTEWLAHDQRPALALVAIGGMGKTALSWVWVQRDVLGLPVPGVAEDTPEVTTACRVPDDKRPEGVLWWSFYETQASFASFLPAALTYISGGTVDPARLPSDYDRVRALLGALQRRRILLVLDGFERELRAYASLNAAYQGDEAGEGRDDRACIAPAAAEFLRGICSGGMAGRVLITSRLFPKEMEGHDDKPVACCHREDLTAFAPEDAVAFFHAQGIKGTHAEIEAACAPFGYHPLALRLLSGMVIEDPKRPGDIAAAPDYDPTDDLIPREHHILQLAYDALKSELRDLLSRIAAFRSPMGYEAVQAISTVEGDAALKAALRQLVTRGFLFFDRQKASYDLHPVVRRYAYDRLVDREGTHTRLREYFAAVPKLDDDAIQSLDDLAPVIELYHHTVRAGGYNEAFWLFHDHLTDLLYYRFGACQACIELVRALFPDGEDRPPRLNGDRAQTWTLDDLALAYSLSGQPRRAVKLLEMHNAIEERRENKTNLAIGLDNLAQAAQLPFGLIADAEDNLRRAIQLCRDAPDWMEEAAAHRALGLLLAYRGEFEAVEQELADSLAPIEQQSRLQSQSVAWSYRALSALLAGDPASALGAAGRARDLADETARTRYPFERDIIRVEWLLGWAKVALAQRDSEYRGKVLIEADAHLTEALTRCRRINLVESEPDILLARARWHRLRGEADAAREVVTEALEIADRCEYRLRQAEMHNFLARLALDADDRDEAISQAQAAYERAWCDGPPHCYKPALDEAERMLNELGAAPVAPPAP